MKTKRNRRRGSALIMVLGILSVLLLMAVAFSSFVRTERSGSTNLKNAVVARSSLYTAVGRVMDAIDLSFDSPDDDSPVAVWPHPWLASDGSVTNDYFQSSALGINETAGAHVLMSEMVPYLTPAQLALARSARCNWAPILGSVNASRARTSANGGLQGLAGRPTKDDLLGRYAFIVLDTTGLGSINMTGGGTAADRKATTGGDTLSLCFPATAPQASDGTVLAPFAKAPESLVGKRMFSSLAQARSKAPGAFLDEQTDRQKFPNAVGKLFPADLFAGFAPSLDGLDPEGNPKIYLPSSAEFASSKWTKGDARNLLFRSLRAMVGVFARSRAAAGDNPTKTEHDSIPIFQGSDKAAYSLPRSYLAAVSLMDGVDDDDVPGRSKDKALDYWDALLETNEVVVKVAGIDVTETKPKPVKPNKISLTALDFPCTEPTLMLESVAAWIEFESHDPGTPDPALDPDSLNWERTYDATLHVVAKARSSNWTKGSRAHQATMEGQFFVMRGNPTSGTSGGRENSRDIVEEDLEYFDEDAGILCIDWDTFFASLDGEIQIDGNEAAWNDSDEGAKCIIEYHSMPIEDAVRCKVRDLGNGTYDYYPICRAAHDGSKTDVFLPVCVQVTIKEGNRIKQQVPAPALEQADPKEWWIRVNPGVYHGTESSFGGTRYEKDEVGRWPTGTWNPSYGWAFCAVPAFAFDTTSLVAPAANSVNFWISDEGAHPMDGGASSITGAAGGEFPDLDGIFWSGPDPNDAAYTAALSLDTDQVGGGQNWIQVNWLVNEADNYSHIVDDFLYAYTSPNDNDKPWKRHAPDFLHKADSAGRPFLENNGAVSAKRLIEELTSRFPSGGYESVGDLGTVMCGPLETLSLYKTWRHGSGKADFHPVIDYFTTARDRYPTPDDYRDATDSQSGVVNWGKLSGDGSTSPYKDLYSAAHDGRVNLNAPYLVECTKVPDGTGAIGVRGDASDLLNPLPIAIVLNGAPYLSAENGSTTTNALKEEYAVRLARDLCLAIENADPTLDELWAKGHRWSTNSVVERAVVRHLSFLGGMDDDGVNTFLDHFVDYAKPQCDIAREGLLAGIVDGFTTRGQTYLAIIRADAYSPKFGENASVEDGTTLATTHAIVEFFRDPLPARAPDGSLPADKKVDSGGEPVIYHNWYIRSFRVF